MRTNPGIILQKTDPKGQVQFILDSEERSSGIKYLAARIELGDTITLSDNRNKRQGTMTLSKKDSIYLISEGGHGFSFSRETRDQKEIIRSIKAVSEFNLGHDSCDNGTINKRS